MKNILRLLLFFGIGAVIMTLVYRSQNNAYQEHCRVDGVPASECNLLEKLWHDFSTIHIGWMLGVIAAFTFSNALRAWRWQMLLESEPTANSATVTQPRFSTCFWSIILGYFASLGLPRMGEVVRAGAVAKYEKIPVEKVMGTVVIDRLMDFLCLGIIVALALIFEGETVWNLLNNTQQGGSSTPLWQKPIVKIAAILFFGGAIAAWFLRKAILALPFVQKLRGILTGFLDGLRSVMRLRNPLLFIAYSLGIWLMFYLQCLFNLWAFPPTAHLDAGAALMIFLLGTFGFVIPSPGGMGTFHFLCIMALGIYGISGADGFSYANIAFFSVQIFYNILGGLLALAVLRHQNKA